MAVINIVARLDVKGSEGAECYHFTFGKVGSPLSGGFYLQKSIEPPTALAVDIPNIVKEKEKEGDKDAKR